MTPTPATPTIRADCTDQQLNEAMAVHCAGWKESVYGLYPPGLRPETNVNQRFPLPQFSTDASAVLVLLDKWKFVKASKWVEGKWLVSMSNDLNEHAHKYLGYAPTFCRAACFALLRANGVTVVEQSN